MERIENIDEYKQKLLMTLTGHIGKSRIVGMGELYEKVFGKSYNRLINDTRTLRKLVEILRREGVPVCSSTKQEQGDTTWHLPAVNWSNIAGIYTTEP